MALIIQWNSGDGLITCSPGTYIGFFSGSVGGSIPLNNYQDKTIITNNIGTGNLGILPNVKYIDNTHATWNSSPTSKLITQIPFNKCTLKISLTSGSAVRLQSVKLIAYSGSSINNAPDNMNVMGFEKGNTSWTFMSGSAYPLVLTPHVSSGSVVHNYYACLSASPTKIGVNSTVSLAFYAEWF